jgi:hypothetical protein
MFTRIRPAHTVIACLTAALLSTAACGGSDGGSANSAAGQSSTGMPTVKQAVTETFQRFFAGSTDADHKIALLENGQAFATIIRAQAGSPTAKSATATVGSVVSSAADHADVTFTVMFNGKPALIAQPGSAVRVDGGWKVSAATFCTLLTLEGNPPPLCAKAAPVPAPTAGVASGR